ncbi:MULTISPECIES: 2,3-dihydro-2,3-dihydroxybenzoate dehydrogenase [unclassified Streptomyces]|uniref:2,3-dihydro-2,3-dihydroxybenzoate dehydrogenase n=1 Tax=unclassified Streptomyces TaxID=2593676 RepID=UPI002259CA30|nr:2,3-dihydro-2,3-dihydroxybenzoate dehydrogenase [Streptomyces sp. NBC_01481]MCX4582462.1 2,3-dihydro-2,3-dihydroxybenzoate dehydrogenase [Streptomyces sp. NBC_01481]WSY69962.1 2,3-dihydro-2,3-dihydroxybenzoate dehydrogenase [Streptomyces sp. NBC_00885]WSY77377.1 2,3-dihydro-2,3-dihydroxybenzoate dehydrogenase [Streptomyces sp. NBC_00879]
MTGGLSGVAVVTGAAGGIGAEIARSLVAAETPVALLDRDVLALWELAAELDSTGVRVLAVATDVTDSGDVDSAVAKVEVELGPIEYLVNAAGVLRSGQAAQLTDEEWDTTFAVNAGGVFHMSRAVARVMVPRGSGSIVTVASNAAATPRMSMSAYAASKAASAMFTKCLGLELAAHGIRCNVVAPGSTRTPMLTALQGDAAERASIEGVPDAYRVGIPLRRIAEPSHIADAVLFLLSERASHITMHDLTVDGGAALGA